MISNRPYLIRAIYQWIVDNDWTPHIQVDANYPGVLVPQQHVQDGVIVLNLAPSAVQGLDMDNALFTFRARFSGVEQRLAVPPQAVLAIFARENGQGMPLPPEPYPETALADEGADASAPKSGKPAKPGTKKPGLRRIK
ncbi:ClpXP protease specificity-enhancing factor [Thiomicrospira sp. ALE5]|uniref:ClpXP protease specificity-enhancing factor n=1 Tax=Thiomicrospira sp. ALE5 TaxID=748650 RepID=UPI0008E30E74|nr:ClpXP protease specificity-enhancing factor [Thiomicrospira sp. ALE5]SFR54286.1 stringent starvation protein B [Thiomicrospira sp. ALE5]